MNANKIKILMEIKKKQQLKVKTIEPKVNNITVMRYALYYREEV